MGKILVIAEKPQAGADIAKVIGATERKDGYLEGDKYVVTWAVGHLIGLKPPQEHDEKYKKWALANLPIFFDLSESLKVLPETSRQFKIIKSLIHREDIDMLINAGDAGREGYLIQEWIYRMAGCRLPKKVLWASSLTADSIRTAMNNLKDNDLPEFQGLLREAEARAEGDYILGYNYSPLLTLTRAYRQTLSYGRCQTPLLNLIGMRDEEIANFKSRPYWNVEITYSKGFKGILVSEEDEKAINFSDKSAAEKILKKCTGSGIVKVYEKQEKREKAPLLYDLSKLQQDMGRKYGFSPDKTLSIAQNLYEKHKVMSYPRTDSQYLSTDIYDEIVKHLESCNFGIFQPIIEKIDFDSISADKSYFNNQKVTDHHALIPTINPDMETIYSQLSEDERKVFDTIIISLVAIFYPDYQYDATKIIVDISGNLYKSTGTTIKQLGYKELFKNDGGGGDKRDDLQILPAMQQGDIIHIDSSKILEKKTTAPKKYTDETIIKLMKKYGIGTSATRAEIIKKLQNPKRQFIVREKGKYSITDLGKEYIRIVPDELKDSSLTQKFEENLKKVNEGVQSKDEFLMNLVQEIQKNIKKFTAIPIPDEEKIGFAKGKPEKLGICPHCGAEVIKGIYGAYCINKCGMNVSRVMGAVLTDSQIKSLLEGKKTLVKGLKGKKGSYDAYLIPEGIEDYSYVKDGKEIKGSQYKVKLEFPKRKSNKK